MREQARTHRPQAAEEKALALPRWPDEVRDEVFARLLALSATRRAEELAAGTAPGMKAAKKTKPKKTEENFQLE